MAKTKLGSKPFIYPYPVTLLGANVDGKPNYMALSFAGIVNMGPAMTAIGVARNHHTSKGIKENMTFSLNLPSTAMLEAADYVGMVSGASQDKSRVFKTFYGGLKTAPMVEECPISLECKVLKILDLGGVDDVIIGEIVESYCEEGCLTGGNPDVEKMKPFVLSMFDNRYFGLGRQEGKAWSSGKNYGK